MFIQKIRDGISGVLAKIIIFFIILVLALFGMDSLVGLFQQQTKVAEVNGQPIARDEFIQTVEAYKRSLSQDYTLQDINEELIQHIVLEELIRQKILHQAMQQRGIIATDAAVLEAVQSIPEFQDSNQRFNVDALKRFLADQGQSFADIKKLMANQILMQQLDRLFYYTSVNTDKSMQQFARIFFEQRDVRYLMLDTKPFRDQVKLKEQQIADYYATYQQNYREPARVKLEYITYTLADLSDELKIGQEQLARAYQEKKQLWLQQQRYQAAHILIKTDQRSYEDALQRAYQVREELDQGQSFADMAARYSEDEATRNAAGKLGLIQPSALPDALANQLINMSAGEISSPIASPFGIHILQLISKEATQMPLLEAIKPSLMQELKQQEAQKLYAERAEAIANQAFTAQSLEQVANHFHLAIQETDFFNQQDGGRGIAAEPEIIQQAFHEDMREGLYNSDLIEIAPYTNVIFRVQAYQEERQKDLTEVYAEVKVALMQQQTSQLALAAAREAVQQLENYSATKPTESIIANNITSSLQGILQQEISWQNRTGVSRSLLLQQEEASDPILRKAFQLGIYNEKPVYSVLDDVVPDKIIIMAVSNQKDGDYTELTAEQRAFVMQYQTATGFSSVLQAYISQIKAEADIEYFFMRP